MRLSSSVALGLLAPALAVALASAATAQTPPPGIEWMALRDINADGFDPQDPTNRPPLVTVVPDGMIRAVDVSDDGRPDWLVDYQPSGVNAFCGTGGCVQKLYVSVGDGYVRVFDNQALTLTVTPDRQVETWVHRIYCRLEVDECRYRFAWSGRTQTLEPVWSNGGQAAGQGGYAAIDPDATE